MKSPLGGKCVHELLAIPNLVGNNLYTLPFTGLLRCYGTEIVILLEKVVNISEVNGKARIEIVVDAEDELRRELEKAKEGKIIQEEKMAEGKIKLSILVDPNDLWDLKAGKDASGKAIFFYDLNA